MDYAWGVSSAYSKPFRKVPIIHTDHNVGTHTNKVKWAVSMARAWPLSKTVRQILSHCEHLFGGAGFCVSDRVGVL